MVSTARSHLWLLLFGIAFGCEPVADDGPRESEKADGVAVKKDGSVTVSGNGAFELVVTNRTGKVLTLKGHHSDKTFTRGEPIAVDASEVAIAMSPELLRNVRLAFYDPAGAEQEMTHIISSSYSGPSGSVQRVTTTVVVPGKAAAANLPLPSWVTDIRRRGEKFRNSLTPPSFAVEPPEFPATVDQTLTVLGRPSTPLTLAIETDKDIRFAKFDARYLPDAEVCDVRSPKTPAGRLAFYSDDRATRYPATVVVALVARDGFWVTDASRIGKPPVTQPGEQLWLFVNVASEGTATQGR